MLSDAIGSLVSQTCRPKIIVHDNCPEGSGAVVCKNFPNVKYHQHETNLGAVANFCSLVTACDTEYFGWLQDDDVVFSNYIDEMSRCLSLRHGLGCVLGFALHTQRIDRIEQFIAEIFGPPGKTNWLDGDPSFFPRGAVLPWSLVRSVGFSPVAIFNTEFIRKALAEVSGADFGILWERAIVSSISVQAEIGIVPKFLGIQRKHNESASNGFLQEGLSDGGVSFRKTLVTFEKFIDAKATQVDERVFHYFQAELLNEPTELLQRFYSTSGQFTSAFGMRVSNILLEVLRERDALPKKIGNLKPPKSTLNQKLRYIAWETFPPFISKTIQRIIHARRNSQAM